MMACQYKVSLISLQRMLQSKLYVTASFSSIKNISSHSIFTRRYVITTHKQVTSIPCSSVNVNNTGHASHSNSWFITNRSQSVLSSLQSTEIDRASSDKNPRSKDDFHKKVVDVKTLSQVLRLVKDNLTSKQAVELLVKFGDIAAVDGKKDQPLLSDPKFTELSNILHNRITFLDEQQLLHCLKVMFRLTNDDLFLINSLEWQVRWFLKRCSVEFLYEVILLHNKNQITPLRKSVLDDASKMLEQRWPDSANPHLLVSLFYHFNGTSEKFKEKLEAKAIELSETMSGKDLYKILYIHAKQGRRNTPLIRTLTYHLNKQTLHLNFTQWCNLAYATATLNMHDTNLLDKITDGILNMFPDASTTEMNSFEANLLSLMQSLSALKWRHTELLDQLCDFISVHRTESPSCVLSLMRTAAILNYMPKGASDIFEECTLDVRRLKEEKPEEWLDIVWCSLVLDRCSTDLASSVMNEDFLQQLLERKELTKPLVQLKLLNIEGACLAGLIGTNKVLPESIKNLFDVQVPARNKRSILPTVMEALTNIAPAEKYLKQNVIKNASCVIDIEMVVNDKGEPQRMTDDATDNHRLAIRVLDFGSMTLCTIQPSGVHALIDKILQAEGYKVVTVNYTDFTASDKVVRRVQILQQKIQNAI